MKGKIYKYKDNAGNIQLPVTVDDAIQMSDGTTLAEKTVSIENRITELEENTVSSVEHDLYLGTLVQGKPSKINSQYDGISTTGTDAINNVVMCDCLELPLRKCTIDIRIPSGLEMKIVVNYNPARYGTVTDAFTGNTTYTFDDGILFYRCYFYRTNGESLTIAEVNSYIDKKQISITYCEPYDSSITERNDEAAKKIIAATLKEYSSSNHRLESYQYMILSHISDLHGDVYRAKNFYKWCKYIGVDYAVITGDEVGETKYNGMKYLSDVCDVKTLICTGNHDCNFSSSDSEVYTNVIKPFSDKYSYVHPSSNTTYYYYDDTKWKIRFIALDIYGSISSYDLYNARITQNQINWFVSTLSSIPQGYGVVVIMHAPEKAIVNNDWGFIQADRPYLVYHENKTGDVVATIIDAFIGKTSFSTSYTQRQKNNNSSTETISVSGNFSNVASNEFICYLTGHEHSDGIGYYSGTTHCQLMLNVCTGQGLYGQLSGSTSYRSCANLSDMPRGRGKIEDCFNTYIIDRDQKKVIVVRVGSDVNRFGENRKNATISYVDTEDSIGEPKYRSVYINDNKVLGENAKPLKLLSGDNISLSEIDGAIRISSSSSGKSLDDYYTSAQTDTAIATAMAAETARTESAYLKEHQSLDDYYTSAQTDSAITEAIGEIVTEIEKDEKVVAAALNDLHSGITTINEILESAVTSADVQEAIEDAMAVETARTETTYLKEHQSLAEYYTSAQTDNAIATAMAAETARTETTYLKEHQSLTDYYTSAQTDTAIATAMAAETARTETTYLKEHQSLADYYTSGETDSKIDSALTDYMTVSELNEIFSVLEKKPAIVYQHDGNNPICGQTGNLFTATVWHTLTDVELSNYSRLRIYVNPSKHNVGLSTDNLTSAAVFELSLDNGSLTSDVPYYSGGIMAPCLNNDNRIYSLTAMVRNNNDAWQIAFKAVSLYGTSSTDITNSYIYKIEGIYDSSNTLVNPVTTYSGSGIPNPQDGNNGDLYLQTE